jgi:hypothetical protein
MKLAEVFPSNFLKSEDLQDRDVTVVIAGAVMDEKIGKLVLSFQGKKKQMVCNKTNANRIAYLYGDETDEWTGKEIVLTSEFVEFQGKTVKGLRVKPPQRRAAQPSRDQYVDRGGYKLNAPKDGLEEVLESKDDFR